jgi:hypothetical protein
MTNRDDAALTDAMLELEIERALAVEPSPEFLARVRTHIASAPETRRWTIRWPLIVAASAAAIVLMVTAVVMSGRIRSPRVVPPESTAVVVRTTEPAPPPVSPPAQRIEPRRRVAASMMVKREVPRSTEPEVLIPKGEAAALRRLMRGLHTGAVDPSTIADGSRARGVVLPTGDIVLEPLAGLAPVTLEPLAPMTRQEGVRQ